MIYIVVYYNFNNKYLNVSFDFTLQMEKLAQYFMRGCEILYPNIWMILHIQDTLSNER